MIVDHQISPGEPLGFGVPGLMAAEGGRRAEDRAAVMGAFSMLDPPVKG